MRLLIAAASIFLGACSLPVELLGPTDQQRTGREEGETCANIRRIGDWDDDIATSIVFERRPLRTSDVITRDGKMSTIWAYRGSYLYFLGGKLERIQPGQ